MQCSSKTVAEPATKLAVWRCGTAPDPGMGARIAWAGGDARGQRTLGAIRKALASVGRAAQEAPPALDPVKPTGGDRDEDLVDARVGRQPVADGSAGVAREMVRDQPPV